MLGPHQRQKRNFQKKNFLPKEELLACGEELLPEEEELITDFNLELLVP
jgi:hypothetical protein